MSETDARLDALATLAGFYAAHAVWSVSDGTTLTPLLGFVTVRGLRELTRIDAPTLEEGVRAGLAWLDDNPDAVDAAVFVYDGWLTLPAGRVDALVVEARHYAGAGGRLSLTLPYRPAGDPRGFAVHRPKFVDLGPAEARVMALSTAFFRGVNQHREAAPVWKAHQDDGL